MRLLALLSSLAITFGETYMLFPFFNELELLELQFEELYDVVDHFVILESCETYMGQPKPFYFDENKERFAPYLDKVIHIKLTERWLDLDSPWPREWFQRDKLLEGIAFAKDDDLIVYADVDEVVSKKALEEAIGSIQPNEVLIFQLDLFRFYLNLSVGDNWLGHIMMRADLFKRFRPSRARRLSASVHPNFLRQPDRISDPQLPNWMREKNLRFRYVPKAGWHFTSMGGIERVIKKMNSWSHAGDDVTLKQLEDPAGMIAQNITNGTKVEIDETFPEGIYKKIDKWKELGFILE